VTPTINGTETVDVLVVGGGSAGASRLA